MRTALFGPDAHIVGVTALGLADAYARQGRLTAAELVYRDALARMRRGTDAHPDARRAHAGLAAVLARGGRAAEAARHRALAAPGAP